MVPAWERERAVARVGRTHLQVFNLHLVMQGPLACRSKCGIKTARMARRKRRASVRGLLGVPPRRDARARLCAFDAGRGGGGPLVCWNREVVHRLVTGQQGGWRGERDEVDVDDRLGLRARRAFTLGRSEEVLCGEEASASGREGGG